MKICKYCLQEIKLPDTLGGRLKYVRRELDISKLQAANILNVSISQITAIEREKADIRFGQLKTLASYYKKPISFFIGE